MNLLRFNILQSLRVIFLEMDFMFAFSLFLLREYYDILIAVALLIPNNMIPLTLIHISVTIN